MVDAIPSRASPVVEEREALIEDIAHEVVKEEVEVEADPQWREVLQTWVLRILALLFGVAIPCLLLGSFSTHSNPNGLLWPILHYGNELLLASLEFLK